MRISTALLRVPLVANGETAPDSGVHPREPMAEPACLPRQEPQSWVHAGHPHLPCPRGEEAAARPRPSASPGVAQRVGRGAGVHGPELRPPWSRYAARREE